MSIAPPPAQAAPGPVTAEKPHVLGTVALITAAVGFIFACIPGALIVGWVLLPIAFILSLVALFMKGKKSRAVIGLILSVVGTIVGFVVFFAVMANALGGTDTAVAPPSGEQSTQADANKPGGSAGGQVGTRDNPAALGSTISSDEFDVVVNSVNLNGTDEVLAANQFNDKPEEGFAYAVINLTITYKGDDSSYAAMVGVSYVTSSGTVITGADTMAVAPDPSLGLDEMYNGGSVTGNMVLSIPTDGDGLLRVRPGMLAKDVFVAVR